MTTKTARERWEAVAAEPGGVPFEYVIRTLRNEVDEWSTGPQADEDFAEAYRAAADYLQGKGEPTVIEVESLPVDDQLKQYEHWAKLTYAHLFGVFRLPARYLRQHHETRETVMDVGTVTVCAACLQASCWQGAFYCEEAKTAGTVEKTRTELRRLALEDPSYWDIDPDTGCARRRPTPLSEGGRRQ